MDDLKNKILRKLRKPTLSALATLTADGKPWVRYVMMSADEDLTLHFSTFRGSRKTGQIRKNAEVHVLCGVTSLRSASSYVQVQGRAKVISDLKVKKAHWRPDLKAYFSGPADPNYLVVEIEPYRIEYQTMTAGAPEIWEPARPKKAQKR